MRLIFFVLLAANVLMLAWMLLREPPTVSAPAAPERHTEGVPQVRLLSEWLIDQRTSEEAELAQNTQAERGSEETPSAGRGGSASSEPNQALCRFIGPFDSSAQAELLVERLAAVDVVARVDHLEISAGPGYWVYLAPLESRREALRQLAELQSRGIDSYIIPRGELANGISLGMFSRERLALARAAELSELGIEAEISTIDRTHREIWVSAPASAANALGDQAWENALEGLNSAEHKQNFCLHVAS